MGLRNSSASGTGPAATAFATTVALAACGSPTIPLEVGKSEWPAPARITAFESEQPGHGGAPEHRLQENAAGGDEISPLVLTLDQAVNLALDDNRGLADARDAAISAGYSILAAEAEFELKIFPRADANVAGATGAGTSEDLSLRVDLEKKLAFGTQLSTGPSVERIGDQYTSALELSILQPLIRGRDPTFVRSAVDSAEFSARLASRNLYASQVSTILSTVSAVYQVVRQRELVRFNEDSRARLDRHAEAARAKERAGLANSIDVYRATLQLNLAQDSLSASRDAYQNALDSLRFILALPITQPLEVEAPLEFELVQMPQERAIETALNERIELIQARDSLQEARRQSAVARHNTLPDLNLLLSFSQFGTSDSLNADIGEGAFSVSLQSTSDLARTAERSLYEQSRLQVSVIERALASRRDLIVREVKQELRNLDRTRKRVELQRERIDQSSGKLELARLKFDHGLANNFDMIEAESELREAQTSLVSAVIDYIIGTYSLRAALGTLLLKPAGL